MTGRRDATLIVLSACVTLAVVATAAQAQLEPIDPLPTSTTTPPTLAPVPDPLKATPSSTTTTAPPRPAPAAKPGVAPAVPVPGGGGGDSGVIPAGVGPFPAELRAMMNSVRRTPPRNTRALLAALKGLTDLGVPLDEAMRIGMGRFPVAGSASYSHDWWFPRFGPGWRLHLGTDVFAARGTPLRSPTEGVVRFSNGGLGGIATYVVQRDGTYFYLAHLEGRPPGLVDGQAVRTGDIVGYVGTSGNAEGGTPHLHFEVHPAIRVVTTGKGKNRATKVVPAPVRPGTVLPAVDPKPYLDQFLQEALADVPRLVAERRAFLEAQALAANATPSTLPAAGSQGALGAPELALGAPAAAAAVSPNQSIARAPLNALAFLLVLFVGALTPVLAPRQGLVATVSLPRPRLRGGHRRRRRRRGRREEQPAPEEEPSPAAES